MQQAPPAHVNSVKSQTETSDFYIQQFFLGCLAEFSYYVESSKEVIIIDPLREIDQYIQLATTRNATIKYVFETHFHADFVSGHLELAKRTGAKIVYGPSATPGFESQVLNDGDIIALGNIKIRADHTPGHTLESTCYVLLDTQGKEHCVFSGDTLFLGDVGRPDLTVKNGELTKEQLAGQLYDSLRNKVMKLPDDCILYPAHGAGSSCGKAIGAGSSCTIGKQKQDNYALQDMTKETFIAQVCAAIPKPPQYFFHDAAMNKSGPESLDTIITQNLKSVNYEQFTEEVAKGALILDARDKIIDGLIDGALNIGFSTPFATWVGTLIQPNRRLVLVVETGKEETTVIRLARIGYQNVAGYLEGGFESFVANGGKTGTVRIVPPKEFLVLEGEADNHVVLDIRKPGEWSDGVLPNAVTITLQELEEKIEQVPRDKVIHVYCKSGGRAKMAASILQNNGVKEIVLATGGIDAIAAESNVKLSL